MTEPKVEAGDRALRAAIMEELGLVEQMAPFDGRDKALSPETIANLDKLIQSAMNAQERELREALKKAARNLYEASELLRDLGSTFADNVFDSSQDALFVAERGGTK